MTGAGGFLGSAIAKAAANEGHEVLSMHRPTSPLSYADDIAGIIPVPGDLRQDGDWRDHLARAESVIHCAAAASGDLATQLGGTVLATENLLTALPDTLARFVHISSFSVYDFGAPPLMGPLDERTPLERRPLRRDTYTQTKLMQEEMVRAHCRAKVIPLVVIRPGAIYGPGKDWDFGRALRVGPFDLIFAPLSRMRLIHVDDCARAIVAALSAPFDDESIVNIVGSNPPTHWGFHRRGRQGGAPLGWPVPVPYALLRLLGGAAWLTSKTFFNGRAQLPELLDPPRIQARWRPLRYANTRARSSLGWDEGISVANAVTEMLLPRSGT
ncbi:NAD(P)-dependent oxidoreductase [Novosphingobium sp. Gsoil 351]|uniref:NAD-dependent epimerase/dehydratase family protein n=1 Tax=Novosphingobium sp. Gsoil 351 TaxID=2675225 RepID=UPI0018A81AE5|nr:NAD(P)-dependent oxidoreductase [Novosphingobium sp. Gsoil 351]